MLPRGKETKIEIVNEVTNIVINIKRIPSIIKERKHIYGKKFLVYLCAC